MGIASDLNGIKTVSDTLTNNKVSRFAYTQEAYTANHANGTASYAPNQDNNIPLGTASNMKVNQTVIELGWRARASSITRMLMNHFLGRISYNLNKANDMINELLTKLIANLGTADGIATLDSNGRIPYSQLPESAVELKGYWNASTNTPTLVDGTGTNGDEYYVDIAGTQDLGSGEQYFAVGDRILYLDGVWRNISGASVRSVDNVSPNAQGNVSLPKSNVAVADGETTFFSAKGAYDYFGKYTSAKDFKRSLYLGRILDANVKTDKLWQTSNLSGEGYKFLTPVEGNGVLVAGTQSYTDNDTVKGYGLFYSIDGESWSRCLGEIGETAPIGLVTFDGTSWCAWNFATNEFVNSNDGITWYYSSMDVWLSTNIDRILCGGGLWFADYRDTNPLNNFLLISIDRGLTWIEVDVNDYKDIVFADSYWLVLRDSGLYKTTNGTNYTSVDIPELNVNTAWKFIFKAKNKLFLIVARTSSSSPMADCYVADIQNNLTWIASNLPTTLSGSTYGTELNSVIGMISVGDNIYYINGRVASNGPWFAVTKDGISWRKVRCDKHSSTPYDFIKNIIFYKGFYFAQTYMSYSTPFLVSTDGIDFTIKGSSGLLNVSFINDVAVFGIKEDSNGGYIQIYKNLGLFNETLNTTISDTYKRIALAKYSTSGNNSYTETVSFGFYLNRYIIVADTSLHYIDIDKLLEIYEG